MIKIILLFIALISIQANAQWVQISTVSTTQLNAVNFFDVNTGIVVGANGIWRSTNAGVNWVQVLQSGNLNAISLPDIITGYAVGDSGKIYKTLNVGLNWFLVNSPVALTFYATWFVSAVTGWVIGQNGKILLTHNGGNSWFTEASQFTQDLKGIYMLNELSGFITGGANTEVFATTNNGGLDWTYTLNQSGNTLSALSYIPTGIVLAVGTNGRIRRSTNYGTTWGIVPSGSTQLFNSIQFVNNTTGYIAGNGGIILQTTNGGLSWSSQSSGATDSLKSIHFINTITGWAVGENGTVLRTGIPVSISQEGINLPTEFVLYQNYPNPFNPDTKIKFSIPIDSKVTIDIYDILGNKVEVLLDEELNKGIHEITFPNGKKIYSSGIYFYRLIYDKKTIIRKMLLIK